MAVDTVKFWLSMPDAEKVIPFLPECDSRVDRNTGSERYFQGSLENLKVTGNEKGLSIQGSLCKYYHGVNAATLTRRDTQRSIEKLSDTLHLPIGEAKVNRVDVAQNFIMKKPLSCYLPFLGQAQYFRQDTYADRETVQYRNGKAVMQFYNKVQEMIKGREAIPALFKNRHVLRYENRSISRLPEQFQRESVKAEDLFDEVFHIQLLDKWKDQYFLIKKIRRDIALDMRGQKELLNSLALLGLQSIGGQAVVLDILKAEKAKGGMGKVQYQRMKEKVLSISSLNIRAVADEDMIELDEKIKRAVNYYR